MNGTSHFCPVCPRLLLALFTTFLLLLSSSPRSTHVFMTWASSLVILIASDRSSRRLRWWHRTAWRSLTSPPTPWPRGSRALRRATPSELSFGFVLGVRVEPCVTQDSKHTPWIDFRSSRTYPVNSRKECQSRTRSALERSHREKELNIHTRCGVTERVTELRKWVESVCYLASCTAVLRIAPLPFRNDKGCMRVLYFAGCRGAEYAPPLHGSRK